MNKFVYATAGGIAVAAVAVFFILGPGIALPGPQERPETQVISPVVAVSDILVTNVEDNRVQVKFTVTNPNQRPIYLEAIQYDLFVNDKPVGGGQWGDIAEGFVTGSEGILIVSGGFSPIPSQPTTVTRNNLTADEWDSMVDGTATYTITGISTYRLTQANLQTSALEDEFSLTFPDNA